MLLIRFKKIECCNPRLLVYYKYRLTGWSRYLGGDNFTISPSEVAHHPQEDRKVVGVLYEGLPMAQRHLLEVEGNEHRRDDEHHPHRILPVVVRVVGPCVIISQSEKQMNILVFSPGFECKIHRARWLQASLSFVF